MDYYSLLDKIPGAIAVFSKVYYFWEKTIGARKAKQKLSLAYQECLKEKPDMRFIKRTLTEYEGKKYLKADLDEIQDVTKKINIIASPKKVLGLKFARTAKDAISSRGKVVPKKVVAIRVEKAGVKMVKRGVVHKGKDIMACASGKKPKKTRKKTSKK